MAEKESPLAGVEPTEKGQRSVERIKERFKLTEVPEALDLLVGSETGASDIYMNLNRQLAAGKVEEGCKLLVAAAVASAVGSQPAVDFFTQAALNVGRSRTEILDGISVAAVCGIFNGYYRFRHQVPTELRDTYESFRAPFNANSFMKSSIGVFEIEAICIIVSSINDCGICVEGHINKAKSVGMSDEQIDEVIKAGTTAAAFARLVTALAPHSTGAVTS